MEHLNTPVHAASVAETPENPSETGIGESHAAVSSLIITPHIHGEENEMQ